MDLKFSPSKLEQFRKYLYGEYNEFIQKEDVIKYLKGEIEWKAEMNVGSAIHAIIEHGPEKYLKKDGMYHVKEKDFPQEEVFAPDEIQPVLDYCAAHRSSVHEVPIKFSEFNHRFHEIIMNMRIDGMHGVIIHEHKTSPKPYDLELYERSVQWRIYLMATEAKAVVYNHFQWKQLKNKPLQIIHTPFMFYPYKGMEDDVLSLINRFVQFCDLNGVLDTILNK